MQKTLKQKMAGFFMKDNKAYFIKLSGEDVFIHYEYNNDEGRDVYEAKPGLTGAAIWKRSAGEAFIKEMKATNLELAEVEATVRRIEGKL